MSNLIYSPREILDCLLISAVLTLPCWLGIYLDLI